MSGPQSKRPVAETPPAAAVEAVARAWEDILRKRHPNVAWEVKR